MTSELESITETAPEKPGARGTRPKRAVLLISSPDGRTVVRLPEAGTATVGRGNPVPEPDAHAPRELTLLPDALLSRKHFQIARVSRGYQIADLESRNGTHLDGRRLERPMGLSEGAIVLFGNHVGVFRQVTDVELLALRHDEEAPFGPAPTFSPALALTYARLRKLARTDGEVLLVGETGVGKEICARAIHRASGRRGPFLAINCASLPAALVESELFGFAAGAHSTATAPKPGLVETAEGGTLLLDEIGDMPPELQPKMFRFLQDRMIRPLGTTRARPVDVRILAATTRTFVGTGPDALRPDLVGRLGAQSILIPALRHRIEEVPTLIKRLARQTVREIEPAALRAMCLYEWPLNVRELEKTLANALAMSVGGNLRLENLPDPVRHALQRGPMFEAPRREPRAAPDRAELEHLLEEHKGNVSGIARALDRHWTVVHRWLARYKLRAGKFRKGKG